MQNSQIKFFCGLEADLPTANINIGALYYCTDTGNIYIGTSTTSMSLFASAIGSNSDTNIIFNKNKLYFQDGCKIPHIYSQTTEPEASTGENGDIYIRYE